MLDPKLFKEEIKEEHKKTIEKKITKIGSIIPHRGHTLFSINKKTYEIKKAEFKKLEAIWSGVKQNREVMVEEGCLYVMALNKKNLMKKLRKIFPNNIEEIITKNK